MEEALVPIYTNLSLPAISLPSLSCLQWSGDGQVFFVSKDSVYILTPKHTADVKAPWHGRNTPDKPLDWFRTMILMDNTKIHQWTTISLEWGTAVFGSLDIGLREIALSPSNLTKDAGCVMCLLNSNMDLSLWTPDKDRLRGKWTKIQDVMPLLRAPFSQEQAYSTAKRALQAQTTSIAWSTQADFNIVPAPALDASLLAVGTRGGILFLLSYQRESESLVYIDKIKVAENGLTHLAYSRWSLTRQGRCNAHLAYGTSDGGVALITVTQSLRSTPSSSTVFGPNFNLETGLENHGQIIFSPDKRALTGLSWLACKENMILIMCKPGLVLLWAAPTCNLRWSGLRSLVLQPQVHKLSVGSSPFHPISGIHYIPYEDILMMCLFDGSIRVIYGLSSEPSWTPTQENITSQILSKNARVAFSQTQPGKTRWTDVNRVSGLTSYDGHATLLWAHETGQPTNYDYVYDAKHQTVLVAVQLWKPHPNVIVCELDVTLATSKTTSGLTPLYLLRSCFLNLPDHPEIYPEIIRLLNSSDPIQLSFSFEGAPVNIVQPTLREAFRRSLSEYFFGYDLLLRLRMKLAVADKLLSVVSNSLMRNNCEEIACRLFQSISWIVLRILIRHLAPVVAIFTPADTTFALRVAAQSLFPDCPQDLCQEAEELINLIQGSSSLTGAQKMTLNDYMGESCPACSSDIRLEGGALATCTKGHSWGRCSITSFILSTGMIRRCSGCDRKAILPPSWGTNSNTDTWLPLRGRSWIVGELLEAVSRCLFCGNSFVNII
ncbi:transcription factor IIIC subunit delta N-term-domain-containing protein [Collybia nuda]|uniref:Transcription factor IIIC subunit delta N-term-domain-containing protein n=1 Tax=Collybia nuda TaxID=64659 RepID=A0A9P5Y1G9_9AGAR|nr:transcription factor IIIC subunit delta N-term-domain-containing protein [Collybia nuda]